VLVQERLCRGAAHETAQLAGIRYQQQPVELLHVLDSGFMGLPSDRREERARIASPTTILSFVIGNEGSSKLLDVEVTLDLREQVPLHGTPVEGIEHHIAAIRPVESLQIAGIRIGDHRTVAA
jgi:hypothetical protein